MEKLFFSFTCVVIESGIVEPANLPDADLPGLRCPAMPCDALSLSKGACRREPAEGSLSKCNPYPE
jgi:hypothetical protein